MPKRAAVSGEESSDQEDLVQDQSLGEPEDVPRNFGV